MKKINKLVLDFVFISIIFCFALLIFSSATVTEGIKSNLIPIVNAEHLDENKNFIENIFNAVNKKDNVWTKEIPVEHHIRITFEKNLTSENDILIYAKSNYTNISLEVYEKDGTNPIANFQEIRDNKEYRVFLNNLQGEQDEFDLRILGDYGGIEIDYIVDPTDGAPRISFVNPTAANNTFQNFNSVFVNVSSNDTSNNYAFADFDDSLVFWMRMDDANSSTAFDLSRYSNNGTLNGSIINSTGYFGNASHFDGFNDSIIINKDVLANENLTNGFTFSAWIYPINAGSGMIFDQATVTLRFSINTNTLRATISNSSLSLHFAQTGPVSIVAGNWYHAVSTFDIATKNLSVYINGTVYASKNISQFDFHGSDDLLISYVGMKSDGTDRFNGTIDEILIFNRTLSINEVAALYNASANKYFRNFTSLSESTYKFKAHAVDSAGNKNETEERIITIDLTNPRINRTDPHNVTYTSLPILFNITTNENSTVNYTLNGGLKNYTMTANISATGFTASNNSIANGAYSVIFFVEDRAGNKNHTENVTFSISVSSDSGSSSSSSSGGGGGSGGGIPSKIQVGSFDIGVNTIKRVLNLNEEAFENILIRNTAEKTTTINILVDKSLEEVVFVNNITQIPALYSKTVLIKLFGAKEGVYKGNVYFIGEKVVKKINETPTNETEFSTSIANPDQVIDITITNTSYVLPFEIIVKSESEKLLQLSIILDKTRVLPGEDLDFEFNVINLGILEEYTADILYEIVDRQENVIIYNSNDSFSINESLHLSRTINIPKNANTGDYQLRVTAKYGNETVVAKESFTIGRGLFDLSPIIESLKTIDLSSFLDGIKSGSLFLFTSLYLPILLAILFVIILAIIGIYYFKFLKKKLFERKIEEIKKNSIYVFPNFDLLPKSRFAYIGHVADSGVKTYLDHTQLNRHTLIAGGTGAGKTVAGMTIVEELLKKGGCPILVFDPVGQWTGFSEKNKDRNMKSLYKKFGISGAKSFNVKIIEINDKNKMPDILYYLKKGGLTVFKLDKLHPKDLDEFIESSLKTIYRADLSESGSLKALIVLDEVHRLLPKYGGKKAHIKLEQAVREFRKWGIGLLMISQVLTDFKGAIRGNIGTEIQLRTRYEGDIKRVKDRHGFKISSLTAKLPTGLGMVECSDYNKGNPYFVEFRPLLHSQFKIDAKLMHKIISKNFVLLNKKDEKNQAESKFKIENNKKRKSILNKIRDYRMKRAQLREIKKHARKNRK